MSQKEDNNFGSKSFPEDLKEACKEWQSGNYQILKLSVGDDLINARIKKKIFIIPFSKQQSKGDLYFGIFNIVISILFTIFLLYLSILYSIVFLILLPFVIFFPGSFGFFRIISYNKGLIMKKMGYIVVGSSGVFYCYSDKKYGYFTWNSIKEIKKGGNIGFNHDGKYIYCKVKKYSIERRKYTHLLRYDNLDYKEITSSKVFFKLINFYWESFRNEINQDSKMPSIYIFDNLLHIGLTIGLLSWLFYLITLMILYL